MHPIRPVAIEARTYRVPIAVPLRTSFGVMHDRPAVVVRVRDADGTEGWGEAWCNFPTVGAEHRARLINDVVGPRFVGRAFEGPAAAYLDVSRALEVLVIQTAEVGPIAQALAGIDIALWDLAARKAKVPLYQALGGDAAVVDSVPVYASGLNPEFPERIATERQRGGHRAFKLKIGFERKLDLRNLAALRDALGPDATMMVDANQGYDLDTAVAMADAIAPFNLAWYEEPMRADAPLAVWQTLAAASKVPLAGGENLRGAEFDQAIRAGVFAVVQPDVAKWGGFSGTLPVARQTVAAGRMFCPHWLTGGIGLVASLHLLAAAGGPGLLEFDANPNPLREMLGGPLLGIDEGRVKVSQGLGLGFIPDLAALDRYRTWPPRA
jgi:D-galactarolactone cycloisomerase